MRAKRLKFKVLATVSLKEKEGPSPPPLKQKALTFLAQLHTIKIGEQGKQTTGYSVTSCSLSFCLLGKTLSLFHRARFS